MTENFEAVWPLGRSTTVKSRLAPRLDTLAGKTVAFLWSNGFRGDEVFDRLKSRLRLDYPGVTFVDHERFGNIHGPDEERVVAELPAALRESGADAVIVGMAA